MPCFRNTRFLLLTFLCNMVIAGPGLAQEVYKTVDENGRVIYSDKPQDNSEKVEVDLKNVQPGVAVQPRNTAPEPKEKQKQEIRLSSPSDGQQLGPAERNLRIRVSVTPKLLRGQKVRFFFDGQAVGPAVARTSASVPVGITQRGRRNVSAQLVDSSGSIIARTDTINIWVIRP